AVEHVAAAERAAERALSAEGSPGDERAAAMRSVGRALALDPSNEPALRLLVRLLVEPVRAIPPEAESAMNAAAEELVRKNAADAVLSSLGGLLVLPLLYRMGVREPVSFLAYGIGLVAMMAFNFSVSRGRPTAKKQLAAFCMTAMTFAMLSRMCGPLLVLPAV